MVRASARASSTSRPSASAAPAEASPPGVVNVDSDATSGSGLANTTNLSGTLSSADGGRSAAVRAAAAKRAAQAARAARGSAPDPAVLDAAEKDAPSPPSNIRELKATMQDTRQSDFFAAEVVAIPATQPYRQSEFGNDLPDLLTRDGSVEVDPLFGGLPGVTMHHIKEAFDEIDFDGNGFIGASELRYLLTAMGERPKDEEIDEMLRLFDDDGNGQVDFHEFQQLFLPGTPVLPEMLSMDPGAQRPDGSPRSEKGSPTSRTSSVDRTLSNKEPPSPKQVQMMLQGAHGFLHHLNKSKKGQTESQPQLPKAKSAAAGMVRARPGTPTKPLPVSPRSVKRERSTLSPALKGKGKMKSQGAGHGKGPMHTTGMDPFHMSQGSTSPGVPQRNW